MISGYTGVGKTEIINNLNNYIDLEALANHKGSVFGGFELQQPTQEYFENLLALKLAAYNKNLIFIEDESRFIGNICIPTDFYNQMKKSCIIILQDLLENRIKKCIFQYKNYKQEDLKNAVRKLEKKLGRVVVKEVFSFIDDKEYEKACAILFSYYDKCYDFSFSKRDPKRTSYFVITNKINEQICAFLQDRSYTNMQKHNY